MNPSMTRVKISQLKQTVHPRLLIRHPAQTIPFSLRPAVVTFSAALLFEILARRASERGGLNAETAKAKFSRTLVPYPLTTSGLMVWTK